MPTNERSSINIYKTRQLAGCSLRLKHHGFFLCFAFLLHRRAAWTWITLNVNFLLSPSQSVSQLVSNVHQMPRFIHVPCYCGSQPSSRKVSGTAISFVDHDTATNRRNRWIKLLLSSINTAYAYVLALCSDSGIRVEYSEHMLGFPTRVV